MTQLLETQRHWWRRSLGLHRGDDRPAQDAGRSAPAPPDSPLARARLAAAAAGLAAQLDALQRDRAPPEQIASVRSELITLRDRLCRAARDRIH